MGNQLSLSGVRLALIGTRQHDMYEVVNGEEEEVGGLAHRMPGRESDRDVLVGKLVLNTPIEAWHLAVGAVMCCWQWVTDVVEMGRQRSVWALVIIDQRYADCCVLSVLRGTHIIVERAERRVDELVQSGEGMGCRCSMVFVLMALMERMDRFVDPLIHLKITMADVVIPGRQGEADTLVQFWNGDRGSRDLHRRLVVGFALMEPGKRGVDVVVDLGLRATDGLGHHWLHRTGSTVQ